VQEEEKMERLQNPGKRSKKSSGSGSSCVQKGEEGGQIGATDKKNAKSTPFLQGEKARTDRGRTNRLKDRKGKGKKRRNKATWSR